MTKTHKLYHTLVKAIFFVICSTFISLSVNAAGIDQVLSAIEKIEKEEAQMTVSDNEIAVSSASMSMVQEKKKAEPSMFTMSILGGKSDFAFTTDFLSNEFSAGFAMGMKLTQNLSVEGSFMYAQFDKPKNQFVTQVDYTSWGKSVRPGIYDVENQYRFGGAVKYRVWDAFLSPVVAIGLDVLQNKSFNSSQWFGRVGMESGTQTLLAGSLAAGLEMNLFGLRLAGMVKGYTTLMNLDGDEPSYYGRPYSNYADPSELSNYTELIEFLGVVSFDL